MSELDRDSFAGALERAAAMCRTAPDSETLERQLQRDRQLAVRARVRGERWATVSYVHAITGVLAALRQLREHRELRDRLVRAGHVDPPDGSVSD